MSTIRYSDAAANSLLDGGLVAFINSGAGVPQFLFYNSTMVATGDTAIGSQILLATLDCADPVEAATVADRTLEFDTITGANAVADGTGTFAILLNANGDRVFACDVGSLTSSATIKLGNTTFTNGQAAGLTAFTISIPATLTA